MADEIHDLLVRVRPDTGDTEDALDGVNSKFDETADETERTAGILGDMSGRMKGFGTVIVGTLTTLAAGLLSQVPVIRETASALGAVVDAIALRVDEFLRPAIGAVNQAIFGLADSIARGEGVLNSFLDVVVAVGDAMPNMIPTPEAIFADFIKAARSAEIDFGEIFQDIKDTVSSTVSDVVGFFKGMPSKISSALSSIGQKIFQTLVQPIVDNVNKAISALNRIPGVNFDSVSAAPPFDEGPRFPGAPRGIVGDPAGRGGGGGGGQSGQVGQIVDALRGATIKHETNLDNRTIAKSQEKLLGTGPAGIGRTARPR